MGLGPEVNPWAASVQGLHERGLSPPQRWEWLGGPGTWSSRVAGGSSFRGMPSPLGAERTRKWQP